MKRKYIALFAGIMAFSGIAVASTVLAIDFVAPSIFDAESLPSDVEIGAIVYDAQDSDFKGKVQTGGIAEWVTIGRQFTSEDVKTPGVTTGNPVVYSARISPASGGCTVVNEYGNFIASTTANGSGDCTLTFESGAFESGQTPNCTLTVQTTDLTVGNVYLARIHSISSSSMRILETSGNITGGSASLNSDPIHVVCHGKI